MEKYPPYVNAYGKIPDVFTEIKKASVPPKFTQDFMVTMLGLKSTSYRAMIPLLKKLGFLDQANVPTAVYKEYRDDTMSKGVMARQVKNAYSDLFNASEYANKLSKEQLTTKIKTMLGAGDDDPNISSVVGTFTELVKLSDFELSEEKTQAKGTAAPKVAEVESLPKQKATENLRHTSLGISYTINLNLPATTEVEVFNAIFKSLKENILDE